MPPSTAPSTMPTTVGAARGTRGAVVALALVSASALASCTTVGDDPGGGIPAPQLPEDPFGGAPTGPGHDPDHPHDPDEPVSPGTELDPYPESPSDEEETPTDDGVVTIGVLDGWVEGEAVAALWAAVLEDAGYEVETQTIVQAEAAFFALEDGDLDLFLNAWLPLQQDQMTMAPSAVDLGAWLDEAPLTIAVNEDAPVTSIDELGEHGDEFGNEIIGIEPMSDLNATIRDEVLPAYGLDEIEVVDGSFHEMLDRLEEASEEGETIAVGLWQPNAVYAQLPLRDLEDPEGAFGEADAIHSFGSEDFAEIEPDVTGALEDFSMSPEQINSLLAAIEEAGDPTAGAEAWSEDNTDYVDGLFTEG